MIERNPKKVRKIFNKISSKYDLLNNLLSLGLHKLWKRFLINLLNPIRGENWADLCCGTGDLAFLINKKVFPEGSVLGIDSAQEILNVAKNKSKGIIKNVIHWKKKDLFELDEPQRFDGICMSYGLRNLDDVENGIKKVYSLLKNGGRAGILDFNHSKEYSFSSIFQKIYLRLIVVPISSCFNLREEYQYIEKSIKIFPDGKNLISISKRVGFRDIQYKTICANQMGILILKK